MQNFEPYVGEEEKDDPVWVRLLVYAFGTTLFAVVFGLVVFFQQSGVGDRRLAQRNLQNVEASNARVMRNTKIAAACGALLCVGICARHELNKRRERAGL